MDLEIFKQLGIAVLLASLVGLEREQKYQKFGLDGFGGIRTFALIGLLGALAYFLSALSIFFSVALTVGFFGLLIASYVVVNGRYKKMGVTSEIAGVIVYLVGVLSGMERYLLATTVALATLAILHFKKPLHRWAQHLKNEEVVSTIQFVVIAFVVLPLLPNQAFGPYGFFNPYIVWLMVVFISGISFASYVAIKLFGAKRGIGLTGFLAGLVSSTALVLSFSGQSKKNERIVNPYVVAVIVASSAMFFRILLEVLVLNKELLPKILVPMLTMGIVGVIGVAFFWFKKEKLPESAQRDVLNMKSPFSLMPALKFGAFFAFILFLSKFANAVMGNSGLYLASAVSGLMDVDAITVSMANLAKSEITHGAAVGAITLAAMVNTVVKGGMFMILGARRVAWRILAVYGAMLLAGGAALMFV
ncbi:MAG: MgtC/SapB family protein [Candidatus Peregrinibacteria bacterium]